MAWVATLGTIANARPRRHMGKLMYAQCIVLVVEFYNQVKGLSLIHRQEDALVCTDSTLSLVQGTVYLSTIAVILYYFVGILLLLMSKPTSNSPADSLKRWKRLFTFCCYGHLNDSPEESSSRRAVGTVASVFSKMFVETDFSTSDLMVGIYLHAKGQQWIQRPPSPMIPVDRPLVERFKHFFGFAEAIYGLPLYLFADTTRLVLCCCQSEPRHELDSISRRLADPGFPYCCLRACSRKEEEDFAAESLESLQNDQSVKIMHYSNVNRLFLTPFMVCLDLKTNSIVIAIRGTMSTIDFISDLNCELVEVVDPVTGTEFKTHLGMLTTSKNILMEIERLGLIENALKKAPNLKVVCCGHSLGAGVSCLLSFLLREKYPDCVSYCFSPPATMVTREGVDLFKQFCYTFVLADDFVCRLSWNSLVHLRNSVIHLLNNCGMSKFQVYKHGIRGLLDLRANQYERHSSFPENIAIRMDEEIPDTFLPGKIVHFQRNGTEFNAVYESCEEFSQIILSSFMAIDHFPNRVAISLSKY